MKKKLFFAFVGAIALSGAVGITSCTDKNLEEESSSYSEDKGEVNVQFVFNVSTSNRGNTRMTMANTQADLAQTFRGISNASILAFKNTRGDGKNIAEVITADKIYDMGTVLSNGSLDPDGSTPKSQRILELSLPTGTNTLMFYGKAPKTLSDFQQGKLADFSCDKDLSKICFSLCKVVPNSTTEEHGTTALAQYESVMAAVLTKIINTKIDNYSYTHGGRTLSGDQLNWIDYVTVTENDHTDVNVTEKWYKFDPVPYDPTDKATPQTVETCALGLILAKAYASFNTIYEDELRAGSGSAIASMIKDLRTVLSTVSNATVTSAEEAVAKGLASAIMANINAAFDGNGWIYDTSETTKNSAVKAASGLTSGYNLVSDNLNEFPSNFNLPLGATLLKIVKVPQSTTPVTYKYEYHYKDNVPTYAMGGTSTTSDGFNPENYVFPPELCYFGNSPVRVTNESVSSANYPDGVSDWDDDTSVSNKWTGWTKNGHVLSSSRSVAMQENINYGTALLKTTVRYGAETLEDNNHNIQSQRSGANELNNTFNVSSSTPFKLTGILVGGQSPVVGWNYIPVAVDNDGVPTTATKPQFNYMIYDSDLSGMSSNTIPSFTSAGANTDPVYTLLWDNYENNYVAADPGNNTPESNDQRDVYVALEFYNGSGKNFWGKNNMIRDKSTFYIVGKLSPTLAKAKDATSTYNPSTNITWPMERNSAESTGTTRSPYALPPYITTEGDNYGKTYKIPRVFMQDYMTTAQFVIGPLSLQNALVAVPDLRAAQISLGLSVDLNWSTGMSFENIILGE